MIAPPSSRSVDPRLAAASGVMRDTVGAIHNLQHLLGSVKVGPKALARVVPDVQASSGPMIVAADEMHRAAESGALGSTSARELSELVKSRMEDISRALTKIALSAFRASDRLTLEQALAPVVRDLDGALELVELFTESTATGRVPVALSDVIRESASRPDTSSGRGRRVRVTTSADGGTLVRVNPRLALRLFSFAVALGPHKDGVHAEAGISGGAATLTLSPPSQPGPSLLVATPALIDLSRKCASEVAVLSGASLAAEGGRAIVLSLPLDPGD
ncbi:MAG TPA: hypothetical protein VHE30_30450 [Polyangiaceae bacterium]|nr:hypothetical protein [Polyangiaceae bacterium]